MREDFLEKLDAMFPAGYVIIYTNPDGNVRMSLYNPHQYEILEEYHQLIKSEKGL